MRAVCTLVAVFSYMVSYSAYLVLYWHVSTIAKRLWVNGSFLFIIAYLLFDIIYIFRNEASEWHKQFVIIGLTAVAINLFLIELYYIYPFESDWLKLIIFNGTVAMVTLCVLFSGLRHKLFSK